MRDIALHYESIVKDELGKQATAFFLSKAELGYAVTFSFAPHPEMGMAPAWVVIASHKSHLLGKGPIGQGAPVYGLLPEDRQIREAVEFVVEKVASDWRAEIEGVPDVSSLKLGAGK
jgi:hypothetical protein